MRGSEKEIVKEFTYKQMVVKYCFDLWDLPHIIFTAETAAPLTDNVILFFMEHKEFVIGENVKTSKIVRREDCVQFHFQLLCDSQVAKNIFAA